MCMYDVMLLEKNDITYMHSVNVHNTITYTTIIMLQSGRKSGLPGPTL